MAFTWGSTSLKIRVGTLRHGCMAGPLTEAPLLPDSTDLSAVSTVLQQAGRGRNRVKAVLYVSSYSDFDAFVTDMNAGTQRTLTIENTSIAGTYLIESVGEPDYRQSNVIFFEIAFVEV